MEVPAMHALERTQIGSSIGVTLPREIMARLKPAEVEKFFVSDAPETLRITPIDPQFEKQMGSARQIVKRRRNVLPEWAT
jgi:hypothetical protein